MAKSKLTESSPRRSAFPKKPPTVHVREKPAKDADTLCGGSHSPIWNRKGKVLNSVGPQQAVKGTCGRCKRVAAARDLL